MADLQYNFLNDSFTTFKNVETPKVTVLNSPITGDLDIGDWGYVGDNGVVYANNNMSKMIVDNNEEVNPVIVEETPVITETSSKTNLKGDQKLAMDFFQSKGLSAHASAGIVGNLMQESKLNPNASGDKGTSFGIAQWRDPQKGKGRWTNLKNFAKKNGLNEKDLTTQLEFLWHELNTDYKSTLQGLLSSSNYEQAATIFMRRFEKPNEKYANLSQRIKNAASLV